MNTSLKDDIRKVVTIAALLVALGMLAITLAIGLPGKSIMSLRESIILDRGNHEKYRNDVITYLFFALKRLSDIDVNTIEIILNNILIKEEDDS